MDILEFVHNGDFSSLDTIELCLGFWDEIFFLMRNLRLGKFGRSFSNSDLFLDRSGLMIPSLKITYIINS